MPKTVSIFLILVISRIANRRQTPTECQSVHTRRFIAANYMAAMSAYDLSFDCTHKAICCSNVLQQFVASCVPAFILQIVSCRSASDSFTVFASANLRGDLPVRRLPIPNIQRRMSDWGGVRNLVRASTLMHAMRLEISPSKIVFHLHPWSAILKTYKKPASHLTIAIDWTRSLRHEPSFFPIHT